MAGYAVQSRTQQTRRRLKKAGFKGDNLETMTEALAGMEERLATKEDLAKAEGVLKQEIADVRDDVNRLSATVSEHGARIGALERSMEALRQEVRDRLEGFRQEVAARMEGMQSQIDALRSEMHALRDGPRGEMTGLRGEMTGLRGEMAGLRGEMAGLRSEVRTIKWVLGGMCALMVPMLAGIIGIALQLAQQ